jgi:hypothetical protein
MATDQPPAESTAQSTPATGGEDLHRSLKEYIAAHPADGIHRFLFASLQCFDSKHRERGVTDFHRECEQGLFVYDIDRGHRLVEKFPAVLREGWRGGWAGVGAHAPRGVFFQVHDGSHIRCYDIMEERLLWERGTETVADQRWAAEPGRDIRTRAFQYIDRRFCVTRDGRHLVMPDRDSADYDQDGRPMGPGVPVLRVLDATTGEWEKNIPLVDPENPPGPDHVVKPHNAHGMRRYIYASLWNDGHVYCIDPGTLEVVRRLGPVELLEEARAGEEAVSDAQRHGTESAHGSQSIQHFSVDPAERYVYVEPVKAFGLGIIDVESGEFLGNWRIPDPEPGSLRARRMATPGAQANQLHSKGNHGIAARPGSTEVWMTDDRWGLIHVWDVAQIPPRYTGCLPVFRDIRRPIYDFSWLNFDIHGHYAYASDKVIDADSREIVATLNGLNESSLEVQVAGGRVVRTGHDMGSGLDTWVEDYDLPPE